MIKELIEKKIDINREIERLGGFTQSEQVLFLIDKGMNTPKLLLQKLGIQKPNLSLLCRKLIDSKLISRKKSEKSRIEIFYVITTKGSNFLSKKLGSMQTVKSKQEAKK